VQAGELPAERAEVLGPIQDARAVQARTAAVHAAAFLDVVSGATAVGGLR
jgi:hypothetical protein